MKANTILMTGVIALVIIGCVIAAGCTSSTTTTLQSTPDDKLVGAWIYTDEDGAHTIVMNKDGTGYITTLAKEDKTRILKHSNLTWTKNADGTVTHKLEKETTPITLNYDAEKDMMVDNLENALTRLASITGIWFREGIETTTGKIAKMTHIIKNDGTGIVYLEHDDGTTACIDVTWKKNADGTYTLSYPKGVDVDWTIDKTGNSANTSINSDPMQKMFTDSYYYLSMLGPWYNKNDNRLVFFNADGRFSTYQNNEKVMEGTWNIPEFGKFTVHIENGTNPTGKDVSGNDAIWNYNRENNTFTAPNGAISVRPSATIGNLIIEKFN